MSIESSASVFRSKKTRKSQETYEQGIVLLNSGRCSKLGDEEWTFLEHLALAAIDLGKLDVADQCLQILAKKFPNSPRVQILTGIRLEANPDVSPEVVLSYYDDMLEKGDPTNVAAWKRRISVLRRTNQVAKAVEELNAVLDVVYVDLEGWLELADLYSSCNQYTHALQALSHALVLAPQNPFIFLLFAETAYTAGDIPLALKMFLLVVDMNHDDSDGKGANTVPRGISVRAWLGIKLCTRRLLSSSSGRASQSDTPVPKHLNLIDELATERVLKAYGGERGSQMRSAISKWMSIE